MSCHTDATSYFAGWEGGFPTEHLQDVGQTGVFSKALLLLLFWIHGVLKDDLVGSIN